MPTRETMLRAAVAEGDDVLTDTADGAWLASDLLNELQPDDLAYELGWAAFNEETGCGIVRKRTGTGCEAGGEPCSPPGTSRPACGATVAVPWLLRACAGTVERSHRGQKRYSSGNERGHETMTEEQATLLAAEIGPEAVPGVRNEGPMHGAGEGSHVWGVMLRDETGEGRICTARDVLRLKRVARAQAAGDQAAIDAIYDEFADRDRHEPT